MVSQYLLLFQYHDHLGISFQVGNLCLKGGDAPLAVAFPQTWEWQKATEYDENAEPCIRKMTRFVVDVVVTGPLVVLRGALHASRLCRAAAAQWRESGREERHGAGEAWA